MIVSPMNTYHVSFRIDWGRMAPTGCLSHEQKLKELTALIEEMAAQEVTGHITSRLIVRSALNIEDIEEELRDHIYVAEGDVAIVGLHDSEQVKVVGKITQDDDILAIA